MRQEQRKRKMKNYHTNRISPKECYPIAQRKKSQEEEENHFKNSQSTIHLIALYHCNFFIYFLFEPHRFLFLTSLRAKSFPL